MIVPVAGCRSKRPPLMNDRSVLPRADQEARKKRDKARNHAGNDPPSAPRQFEAGQPPVRFDAGHVCQPVGNRPKRDLREHHEKLPADGAGTTRCGLDWEPGPKGTEYAARSLAG
jgi:hypothetical protein